MQARQVARRATQDQGPGRRRPAAARVRARRWRGLVAGLVAAVSLLALGLAVPGAAAAVAVRGEVGATTTAPSPSPTADPEDTARAWTDGHGEAQVRAALEDDGTTTPVEIGELRRLSDWAPGFLDGSEPSAEPVLAPVWAAPVTVGSTVTGALVVDVTSGEPTGSYVADTAVAAAVSATAADAVVVHDATDAAWYLVSDGTVRVVGRTAEQLLSGPVDLTAYGQVLRERRGLAETSTPAPQEGTDSGVGDALPLWIPLIAVLLIVAAVVLLTVHHERRVLAPLTARPAPDAGPGDGMQGAATGG